MRRLVILISALMVLDTISFAAVIPLLPHYRQELGLSPFSAWRVVWRIVLCRVMRPVHGATLKRSAPVEPANGPI